MLNNNHVSRRVVIRSSVFGALAVSIPHLVFSRQLDSSIEDQPGTTDLFHRYPSIDDEIVSEVVGASHFNLERVKELVTHRPELARATWDWGFGDWESALGAASHVGRRDIADLLISHGARPNIFTFAMLGSLGAVKAMIEAQPGIQSIAGPHGISLLQHAKNGQRSKNLSDTQKRNGDNLIQYLEQLGDADPRAPHIAMEASEKEKYIGDYMYGDGPKDGFSVKLNMRDLLSLGKLGAFGGALYQKAPNVFIYNGTQSVEISFTVENGAVKALTVREPDLILTAKKV